MDLRKKIVYISGKYSADDDSIIEENIQKAKKVAVKLWDLGFTVISPHLNTAHFEREKIRTKWFDYIQGDLEILKRCDILLLLDGWKDSKGAQLEFWYAKENCIKEIYYGLDGLLKFYKSYIEE